MALSDYRLSEIFQERDEIRVIQNTLGQRIYDLRFLRADLNTRKKEFLTEQEELQELQDEILDRKKIVDQSKNQQSVLLKETQYEERRYQNLIAEREALRKAFEQELYAYESKLVFLLDPTLLPARGSGVLSWPLDSLLVTQMFGAKTGPHRTYANGHSGVDFRANGDPVYAMADGVVQGIGDTDIACNAASFGKWILLDFDNNLAATYGHLSIISVKKGQRVQKGQMIGYSGNTGRSTAPHLHVSLYAGVDANGKSPVEVQGKESIACAGKTLVQPRAAVDAYLDLLDYLPPLSATNYKAGVR
jgi:murein DD-endopeptidase MepM/ murein hydrolase activator NlpD